MPRRRVDLDSANLLELLPEGRRQQILDDVLSARAREILELHRGGTMGELFDALKAEPRWRAIREVPVRNVLGARGLRARGTPAHQTPLPKELKKELTTLLRKHRGNVTAVAREMGKHRFQVQRWLKRLPLSAREGK
jgi:hypothetical protein